MDIAFDYNGTLSSNDAVLQLAIALSAAGHHCHVISAVSGVVEENAFRRALAELPVKFHTINFVPNGADAYETGLSKAACMRSLGAVALFDDTRDVCIAVRNSGLAAFIVS